MNGLSRREMLAATFGGAAVLTASRYQGSQAAEEARRSDLWGKAGERWSPKSRLPDFSFAGYRAGQRPIPTAPVKANVKDFGARGDGNADDTGAFRDAIARTSGGVLSIGEGRYKISGAVEISKPNLVLRGAGPDRTVLVFTRPLGEILGQTPYYGGLLTVAGQDTGTRLSEVVGDAERGDTVLRLASTAGIRPGQTIRLRMLNPADNSLGRHLYADQGALNAERRKWYAGQIVDWAVLVASVDGAVVTLARPLRLDVRREWTPQIWSHRPTVEEVGIEDLAIEFPDVQYPGHHKEDGYHAIYLDRAFHCWVRNVSIQDADLGVAVRGGGHNTITRVSLKARYRTGESTDGETGHYGLVVTSHAQDNLVTQCQLQTTYVHNLSVNAFANGNVYASIVTRSGRLDHHGAAPYENLFTDIAITEQAHDLFRSGGNRADEPNSGARTTLWNIRAAKSRFPSRIPTLAGGEPRFPQINIVGVAGWQTQKTNDAEWIESWPGQATQPPNLYEAQRSHREALTP